MTDKEELTGLALMRKPFEPHQINSLPKPTAAQTDAVKKDFKAGVRCEICGGWHHPKVVHLDYVGHAALTDRLLDCDPEWSWEPVAFTDKGLPLIEDNTMWIKLTVCGQTRYGFGDAQGKTGANAVKEIIGDALRNAAMRFGAALDLWHKGDLAPQEDEPNPQSKPSAKIRDGDAAQGLRNAVAGAVNQINDAETLDGLRNLFGGLHRDVKAHPDVIKAKDERKAVLEKQDQEGDGPLDGDQIPY